MTRIGLGAREAEEYCLIAVSVLILVAGIVTGTNEGRVEVCEFEDANLIFPNVPAGSAGDIKAKTWNKENGVLLASWMADTNFVTSHSYGDRLMVVGENGIKIRNVTRSDTGTYTLVLTSGSKQDFIEFLVHLEVLVSPSAQCIPNITIEGGSLIAKLPSVDCGIPKMIPSWINRTQKQINGNVTILDLDSEIQGEIYVVCAVGESRRCFQGDITYLCANYKKPDLNIESRSALVWTIILPLIIILILITVGVILACYFRWKLRRKQSLVLDKIEMTGDAGEKEALIRGLEDIKRHLIHQYKAIILPNLSSSGKTNLPPELSPVYFDLEITSLQVENVDDRGHVSTASLQDILSIIKRSENSVKNVQVIPAVIVGHCGTGKSTWCKNIVNEWCSYNENMEPNKVWHTTIPEVARFEILLFLPLKSKLEGHSFADCLRHELFCNNALLFVDTMNYISKHGESVLIIIDGLDAVTDNMEPIGNLLKFKETFPCTTILTSRPDGLECLQKKEKRKLRLFQMHGWNLVQAKEYATKVVGIYCQNYGEEMSALLFWDDLRDLQVQSLFTVPLVCSSLLLYWTRSKAFLDNLIDFLLTVVECYVHHAMKRRWFRDNIYKGLKSYAFEIKINDRIYSREYSYILKFSSTVAKQILSLPKKKGQSQMAIEIGNLTRDIGENCVQLCVESGILVKTFIRSKTKTVTHISFSHILLFDFFAALSLTMEKKDLARKRVKIQRVDANIADIMDMLGKFNLEYWTRNIEKEHSDNDNINTTSKKSGISKKESGCQAF